MSNIYWDLFYKSGKVEQYLKYRGQMDLVKGNEYVVSKRPEGARSESGGN